MARTNKKLEEQPIEAKTVEEKLEEEKPKKQKEWKILAPNKQYTGVAATVEFVEGAGYTENETIKRYFEAKGFEIV